MKIRHLAFLLVIASLAWLLWPGEQRSQDEHPLHGQLVDRLWIDHLPYYPDEKIDVLFLDSDSQIGVFQNMSVYEGDYSLFAWRNRHVDRFDLTMLQQRRDHQVTYRVSDRDCGEFEMCLIVEGVPRGSNTYYSMEDWGQIADSDAAVARVRALIESRAEKRD